jgi:hypothetical protein
MINSLDEPLLADDYPVFGNYLYVCDGKVISSDVFGTVADLKKDLRTYYKLEAKEIRKYDFNGRQQLLKKD